MDFPIIISCILVVFLLTVILSGISGNKKLEQRLSESFGKEPEHQDCQIDSVNSYHDYRISTDDHSAWIDAITWDDLEMDLVFNRINVCCSSVGEEYLYNILALVPLAGILSCPFSPALGAGIIICSFLVNIVIHYALKRRIDADTTTLDYFSSMLWCCKKILSIKGTEWKALIPDLENSFQIFKPLSGKIPNISKRSFTDMDFLTEYIKILFLSDIRTFNKSVNTICKNTASFHRLYQGIGELDAVSSILSFRQSLRYYCIPVFHKENLVSFKGIYHPLLQNPVANDAVIGNHCIITGSNASGKSTFIKSAAINGILSQTINTCCATEYSTRFFQIMTSMAVRDHISEGDSYFITEIKSLKRILDRVQYTPCLCFIDEILKGTNTIERIASSAAVLNYLGEKDCLCMVASHDIELT